MEELDANLICELFLSTERQGPGSEQATLRALSFVELPDGCPQIADAGCGTGGQTLVLARHTGGLVIGVDMFPRFVDKLNQNAATLGLHNRVKGVVGRMEALPFGESSLDLIWSEGAIYNIGFSQGLQLWHSLLKPNGYVAVTECSWLTDERPDEIQHFWAQNYPGMSTVADNVAAMQRCGYVPVATFVLPDECWTDCYYRPLAAARAKFCEAHRGVKAAEELAEMQRIEEQMYARYKQFFGYVFYIGKYRGDGL